MSFSIGGIISQTFGMTRQRMGSLLGVWSIYFGLQILLLFVLFGAVGSSLMMVGSMENPGAMGFGAVVTMVVGYLAYITLYMAQVASVVHNASPALEPTIGDSFMAGLRALPTLAGLTLILLTSYFFAMIAVGIVGGIFSLAGDSGSILFLIFVFVGMIYISCRLSIMIPVIAVDGVGNPITAITSSWKLTAGHVAKIFTVMSLLAIVMLAAFFALFGLVGSGMAGLAGAGFDGAGMAAVGMATMIMTLMGFLVLMVIMTIASAAFMAVLHASLVGPEAFAETFA